MPLSVAVEGEFLGLYERYTPHPSAASPVAELGVSRPPKGAITFRYRLTRLETRLMPTSGGYQYLGELGQ